jgi:hypothetical protein
MTERLVTLRVGTRPEGPWHPSVLSGWMVAAVLCCVGSVRNAPKSNVRVRSTTDSEQTLRHVGSGP